MVNMALAVLILSPGYTILFYQLISHIGLFLELWRINMHIIHYSDIGDTVYYLGGYLHTEMHIISNWTVPGTLSLED
jgi:hypothetical protein